MSRASSGLDSGPLLVPGMQQQQQQHPRYRKAVSTGGGRAWSDAEVGLSPAPLPIPKAGL